jgi:hypothetical protein
MMFCSLLFWVWSLYCPESSCWVIGKRSCWPFCTADLTPTIWTPSVESCGFGFGADPTCSDDECVTVTPVTA